MKSTISLRRHMPLATRLFLLFIAAATLPLGMSGVFGLSSNYLAQRRQVEALQQEIAANTANAIDAYLERIEAEMALAASKWIASTDESAPLLLQTLPSFEHGFETLTLLDRTGQEAVKVSRYTLFVPQDLSSQASSPAFLTAIEGQRYLGPVTISQFEEPLATLAIPVRDARHDVVGALVAEVSLKDMWDIVAQVEIETGGYAYIVDSKGQLIAHRDSSQVLQGQNLGQLAGVRDAVPGQAATRWYTGLEGTGVIGSYQSLRRADWFVLVESPRREALANVYQNGALNLAALATTLGLAALLGRYMARNVVRPVKRLQEGAALIGEGDLAHRIDVPLGDEIGDLAEAFNGMAAQLKETIDSLQERLVERQQAEEALRESEERFRSLVETTSDWIWEIGPDSTYTYASPAVKSILGYEPEELIGKTPSELMPPDEAERVNATFQDIVASQQPIKGLENISLHSDGRQVVLETSGMPILAADGELLGYRGIDRDVTARRQAEQALREGEEKYRDLVENLNVVIYTVDMNGVITYLGPAVESFLGYHPSEITGRPFAELIYPEDLPYLVENHRRLLAGLPPEPGESRIIHKSGEIRWMHTSSRPTYEGERVTGLQGSLEDITDRKHAEEELERYREHLEELVQERTVELEARIAEVEQLNRAMTNLLEDLQAANLHIADTARQLREANAELESFSYSVSHDLRAPLRHIDGFVGMLAQREGERLDETSTRYLNIVRESVGKMGRLIDDLLALSRTGRAEMQFQRIELGALVEAVQRELANDVQERHIDWQIAPLPAIEGDLNLLRQVWVNLISNAIKYTGPRREAQIEIGIVQGETGGREQPGQVALFCRDNGVGFDQKYAHKLFGVFQRLHQADEFEGTGVGLAIVRRIVHRHGGQVWAEGEPDRGATFYLTLKAAGREPAEETPKGTQSL